MLRPNRMAFALMALLTLAVVTVGAGARAAQRPAAGGGQSGAVVDGSQLFKTWCASCHGLAAQGNGPLAPALKVSVPDLTDIAAKNGGMFPSARVRRIIDGRDVVSHGDPEMPIWGTAFKSTRDGYSDESVRQRIDALVQYLESIQRRNAH
ncbi:MAG: cytochrome c [Vicinamibacterales bacterium]